MVTKHEIFNGQQTQNSNCDKTQISNCDTTKN